MPNTKLRPKRIADILVLLESQRAQPVALANREVSALRALADKMSAIRIISNRTPTPLRG